MYYVPVESIDECDECKNKLLDYPLPGGGVHQECPVCESEAIQPPEKLYENHCWNCGGPISSRFCKRAENPNDGYICNVCGADLSGWKKERRVV